MAIYDRYYVTMTDKFFSGWGKAEGKLAKFVVVCDTLQQAEGIFLAAQNRPEMVAVNYTGIKPRYSSNRYIVSESHVSELGEIWTRHIPEAHRPR